MYNSGKGGFAQAAAAAAFLVAEESERQAEESRIKGTFNREATPLARAITAKESQLERVLDANADAAVNVDGFDAARLATEPVANVAVDAAAVLAILKAATSATSLNSLNQQNQNNQTNNAISTPPTQLNVPHGVLLGLDICGTLHISNAVASIGPNAPILEDGSVAPGPAGDHQVRLLDGFAKLGFDTNVVGLFVAANMGAFWSQQLIEVVYRHYKANPQSVLIVYDPLRSAQGNLSIKALRLSASTISLLASKKFTVDSIHAANVSPSNLFETLPLRIRNSSLVNVMLNNLDLALLTSLNSSLEASSFSGSLSTTAASVNATGVGALSSSKSSTSTHQQTYQDQQQILLNQQQSLANLLVLSPNFEALDLGAGEVYLEKHLEALCDAVDDYGQEQWRWQGWNRSLQKEQQKATATASKKRAENAAREASGQAPLHSESEIATPPASLTRVIANEPSRLETLVLAGQVETWCKQINGFAGPGLTKMYLAKAVSRG
ncbi:UNVERIFIED_CONTAM: Eukaryotic translation initiation factor 3 subunit H [Siphonaria sp. JEL0065]|nr:Eukaryotic translation initiation factor 3 subunit H [Siphonaria sp. JEL0065]